MAKVNIKFETITLFVGFFLKIEFFIDTSVSSSTMNKAFAA